MPLTITTTRRPLCPDWVEAELHRRTADEIALSLSEDPHADEATREERIWIAVCFAAIFVSCALPFVFALYTLPVPVK